MFSSSSQPNLNNITANTRFILLISHPAKSAIMDFGAILEKVPKPVVLAFAALGAVVAAGKVFSYIQLLLSLFVLPGTNVSLPTKTKN